MFTTMRYTKKFLQKLSKRNRLSSCFLLFVVDDYMQHAGADYLAQRIQHNLVLFVHDYIRLPYAIESDRSCTLPISV